MTAGAREVRLPRRLRRPAATAAGGGVGAGSATGPGAPSEPSVWPRAQPGYSSHHARRPLEARGPVRRSPLSVAYYMPTQQLPALLLRPARKFRGRRSSCAAVTRRFHRGQSGLPMCATPRTTLPSTFKQGRAMLYRLQRPKARRCRARLAAWFQRNATQTESKNARFSPSGFASISTNAAVQRNFVPSQALEIRRQSPPDFSAWS